MYLPRQAKSLIIAVSIFFCVTASAQTLPSIVFQDNFTGVSTKMPDGSQQLYPDSTKWGYTFWPGVQWPSSYGNGTNWLASNGECEDYLTPFRSSVGNTIIPVALRYNPFSIQLDGLHIKASVLSAAQQADYHIGSYQRFGSGMLLSKSSFTYGKIRVVAKMPSALGSWPAIWMLSSSHAWPPEIDILEGMPWSPHNMQVHSGIITAKGETGGFGQWYDVGVDISKGFHEYGLDWNAQTLTILFDGKPLGQAPTPPSMQQSMYLIINLAVGGKWVYNELGVLPIDSMDPARLAQGSNLIQGDYPAEMIVRSVTVTSY